MRRLKKKWRITFIVLTVIIVIFGGGYLGVNAYINSMLNKITKTESFKKEDVAINKEVLEETKENKIVNIALFGLDNDELDAKSFEMKRSDAIKILTLDFTNKKIRITSLQRDILIWLPEPNNDWSKLNHAYWFGGPKLSLSTINSNFDLDITQYASFSFGSVEKIVDIIGGIDINLTKYEINQKIRDLEINGSEGIYHLNGHQAVQYSRIRTIDDDYYRIQRQNNVIEGIIKALKDKPINELIDIIGQILPYIETNVTNNEIKDYLTAGITFDLKNIEQYQIPKGGQKDTNSIFYAGYGPNYLLRSYSQNVKDIHLYIYGENDYIPSEIMLDIEKRTYEKFGEFKE